MNPDHDHEKEPSTEALLEAVLVTTLHAVDLNAACIEADLPILIEATGTPVAITRVASFPDEGMLTTDRGVYLELSDGSAYTLSIGVYRRGTGALTPPGLADRRQLRRYQ